MAQPDVIEGEFREVEAGDDIEEASELFAAFHDREPRDRSEDIVELDDGTIAICVGELIALDYCVKHGGELFSHRFAENDRPLLYVTFDGSEIVILKGGFRFTDKGFIG